MDEPEEDRETDGSTGESDADGSEDSPDEAPVDAPSQFDEDRPDRERADGSSQSSDGDDSTDDDLTDDDSTADDATPDGDSTGNDGSTADDDATTDDPTTDDDPSPANSASDDDSAGEETTAADDASDGDTPDDGADTEVTDDGTGEADDGEDAGGLTRVEPPEDVPRPEKPPPGEHDGVDDEAGGLRRVDPDGSNGSDAPDDSDGSDVSSDDPTDDESTDDTDDADDAVGHDAHPAEHHEPITGDQGPQPAGHSVGVPTPGDDEYEEWIEGLREQNPDPVPEPDVDSTAPDDGEAGAAVAGPAPATESESDADAADATGESAPPSPPAAESSVDPEPDAGPSAGDGVGAAPSTPGPDDPDFGSVGDPDAPPDDEEMPLSQHVEEMIRRLAVVVIAAGLATAIAFPSAESLLNAMWYGVLPPKVPSPTLYGPLEKILSEIKVASLAGILIALPVLVYEAYLFMRPGLYPKERRYFLAAVPTSLVLGSIGMAFAYFIILPVLFSYFITYSESAVDALPFGLRVTFDLIVSLLGAFALVFQIPLLIMLAVMIGVVTRRWLEEQRILFWGLFLGVGFFISLGDATGTAPIIIALTMISLFEGTLALLRWTGRN